MLGPAGLIDNFSGFIHISIHASRKQLEYAVLVSTFSLLVPIYVCYRESLFITACTGLSVTVLCFIFSV